MRCIFIESSHKFIHNLQLSDGVMIMNMITTSLFCQLMAAFQQAGCCEDCKNVYMINWTFSQKKKSNAEASHSI